MCAQYTVLTEQDIIEMRKIIDEISKKFGVDTVKSDVIRPTDMAPVLVLTGDRLTPYPIAWSYKRRDKVTVFNTRSETILDKPSTLRLKTRCVIPSTGFYEWAPMSAFQTQMSLLPEPPHMGRQPKQKLHFTLPGQPMLYMAGLTGRVDDREVFTIVTTSANQAMERFHDRMPVILSPDECERWVGDDQFARNLLTRECPALKWRVAV